ncbi:MAG: hypothetical protein ACQER9_02865 [Nanobdellota archaeon]
MGLFGIGKKKNPFESLKSGKEDTSSGNIGEENPFYDEKNNGSSLNNESMNKNHNDFTGNNPDSINQGMHNPPDLNENNNNFHHQNNKNIDMNPSISDYSSSPSNQIPPELKKEQPKSHDMELLSSKLDVIKSMIENLTQRVDNLENKINKENERRKGW